MTASAGKSLFKKLSMLLAVGLLCLLSLGMISCTSEGTTAEQTAQSNSDAEGELIIVASVFAAYDFSRTIAGEVSQIILLVPPGVESHSFEPSPADIILLSTADVFLCAGGESDVWLEKILSTLDNPDLLVIRMIDLVETLEVEDPENSGADIHEESLGFLESEHEHEIDEHVWTSLRNAQVIVAFCAESFSQLDTRNAELFNDNAQAFIDELASLDDRISNIVTSAKRNSIVFGDRFPFRYFTEDYDLTWYAAFSGCSTAVDTNPSTLMFLMDTVREQGIPVVFYLELSDQRIARTISEETGAEMLLLHSAHTISRDDFASGVSYLDLMRMNADNLEVALN